jgi:glycosyltransferase involved in cell wall biosynthesis
MTQRVPRPTAIPPCYYKGFRLFLTHGRFFAFPVFLEPIDPLRLGRLIFHPAVLSAPTPEELYALIDGLDVDWERPQAVGSYEGYNLVRLRGTYHGIPPAARWADLYQEEERRLAGVMSGDTLEEVQATIRRALDAVPVEFAGWLPIYENSGNCGRHPQFKHTAEPPLGYWFTCSAVPKRRGLTLWYRVVRRLRHMGGVALTALWQGIRPLLGLFGGSRGYAPRARLRVVAAVLRMFFTLLRGGGRLGPVLNFLQKRHFRSQVLLPRDTGLVFLTSMPYTYGQNPWVIEIEDVTTLFYPHVHNGQTRDMQLADSPYFPIVKTLLESDQCKGILTHMKSTAEMLPTLFRSDKITAKVNYAPLGVPLPRRWQRHDEDPATEPLDLLFINSWCQANGNFLLRGGLDVLEAFAILRERYPHLRLTMRTSLPGLDDHYHRIIDKNWVRVIDRLLTAEEMDDLLAGSHIFLLPAARVHIVSLLQAMSYGLAVVTSDGWGIQEYVTHERNGLIVPGRYGKVSWADKEAGQLREKYELMHSPDPDMIPRIVEAVSRLVEDRELRRRLGRTARHDAATTFTLENWNRGLKRLFDKALAPRHCDPLGADTLRALEDLGDNREPAVVLAQQGE